MPFESREHGNNTHHQITPTPPKPNSKSWETATPIQEKTPTTYLFDGDYSDQPASPRLFSRTATAKQANPRTRRSETTTTTTEKKKRRRHTIKTGSFKRKNKKESDWRKKRGGGSGVGRCTQSLLACTPPSEATAVFYVLLLPRFPLFCSQLIPSIII